MIDVTEPLWRPAPERIQSANITRFAEVVRQSWNVEIDDYRQLHRWSVDIRPSFGGHCGRSAMCVVMSAAIVS